MTGGASGVGREICIQLASQGCKIAVADTDLASAQKTADYLVEMCVAARAYQLDFTSNDDIVLLKKKILKDLGEVDILINNAGSISYKTLFEQTAEELEYLTKLNLNSVVLVKRV